MRLWGEDAAAIARAGADLTALAGLEDGLAAEVAGLGGGVDAVDAHVHLGRDADGHRLAPASRAASSTAALASANWPSGPGSLAA